MRRTTASESFSNGTGRSSTDDEFALSSNIADDSSNEYDWVAAAKKLATSTSAKMLQCANDTAGVINDEIVEKSCSGDEPPAPPQSSPTGVLKAPTIMSNDKRAYHYEHRALSLMSSDTQSIKGETLGGMSELTDMTTDAHTLPVESSSARKTTWDDLYGNNLPDEEGAEVNLTFNSMSEGDVSKSNNAPRGRTKKRKIVLGAAIMLAVVFIAVGVAVPLMLKSPGPNQNEAFSPFSSSNEGENVIIEGLGSPSKAPADASTIETSEQTSNTDVDVNSEGQPIFNLFPSSSLQPLPTYQPTLPEPTYNPTVSVSSAVTPVPIYNLTLSMSPTRTLVPTYYPTTSRESSSANEPTSSSQISGEGLFSEGGSTNRPTIAITNIEEISTPTYTPPSTAGGESTSSPPLRPSTGSPTSAGPALGPSLRPSSNNPNLMPTLTPVTESPITGRPNTSSPVETPPLIVLTPLPTTPKSTSAPISPAPTESTPEPSPGSTSSAPTTKQPTGRPTSLPATLAPTTRQPTRSPTPKPTTRQPTRIPTPEPTTRQPTRIPTPEPTTRQPTSTPTPGPFVEMDFSNNYSNSNPSESRLMIELQTDQYGEETSWTLHSVNSMTDAQISLIKAVKETTYAPFEQDSSEVFLAPGTYRFTLKDTYGDGFCCSNGSEGWYAISLDGREIIRGNYYQLEQSYDIVVGYAAEMSDRDEEWLEAHNSRRKTWHERYDETYIPLMWSKELAQDASSWAEELLDDCEINGISHQSDVPEGENLAKNKSTGSNGMGQLYPADNILRRWVDNEETWSYPKNAHLTQALWRASRYVGCGDAVKNYDDGAICRVQVCRYARAGNCGMGGFNASEGDNWLVPMLMEHTACGPDCPPEGCY